MLQFKSTEDLSKLPATDPAHPTVKDLVDRLITEYTPPGESYNADDYGFVILIQEGVPFENDPLVPQSVIDLGQDKIREGNF